MSISWSHISSCPAIGFECHGRPARWHIVAARPAKLPLRLPAHRARFSLVPSNGDLTNHGSVDIRPNPVSGPEGYPNHQVVIFCACAVQTVLRSQHEPWVANLPRPSSRDASFLLRFTAVECGIAAALSAL